MKILKGITATIITGFLLMSSACSKKGGADNKPVIPPQDKDVKSTTDINTFNSSNIYSINTYLVADNAMQGFNFDSSGSIWYTQSNNRYSLNWVKASANKNTSVMSANTDYMRLLYFGHGTNTAMEEVDNDRYLWVGAYASCNANGEYWGDKVVGRVKYVKGKTVKTNECDEYYYIGSSFSELHPSIDADNDLLTINYNDPANSQYRCFVVYKLSEAKKTSFTNVTISVTDAFETGNAASTNTKSVTVYCRDLTKLTPVAQPKFRKTGYGKPGDTYYDWQGYDVHKDRLYYMDGQSNYSLFGSFTTGVSQAYLTIFDFKGNVVEERTQVAFISNKSTLTDIGVTKLGHMESEGVKVYKGKLYLGFTSRGITEADTKHYQNIFAFTKATR